MILGSMFTIRTKQFEQSDGRPSTWYRPVIIDVGVREGLSMAQCGKKSARAKSRQQKPFLVWNGEM